MSGCSEVRIMHMSVGGGEEGGREVPRQVSVIANLDIHGVVICAFFGLVLISVYVLDLYI